MARSDFNLAYLIFGSVAAGEQVVSLALTEPRGGSDAAGISVRARPVEGGFRVSGEKASVTLGAYASHAIVVGTVDPALRSRGTRRLLVPLDDPTISRQRFADPGFRPLSRVGLSFDDTFVPPITRLPTAAAVWPPNWPTSTSRGRCWV